jgi:hypothetical protein
MIKASPPTPFKMSEPELLLEFLIIALDAPAPLGSFDRAAGLVLKRTSSKRPTLN